jgi:hypothetical protein
MRRRIAGWNLRIARARGPERVQGPKIQAFIVAENIEISVISLDAKIGGTRRIPAILNVLNFKEMAAQDEAQRSLVGTVTRITLDANLRHDSPPSAPPDEMSVALRAYRVTNLRASNEGRDFQDFPTLPPSVFASFSFHCGYSVFLCNVFIPQELAEAWCFDIDRAQRRSSTPNFILAWQASYSGVETGLMPLPD